MPYGSNSYGAVPYGGLSGVKDETVSPAVQSLSLTLHIPVCKHSNSAEFALGLTVHAPSIRITQVPSVQALTVTQHAPTVVTSNAVPTQDLTLTLHAPTVRVTQSPAEQSLTVSVQAPSIAIKKGPSSFPQSLTLHQPTVRVSQTPSTLGLTVTLHDATPNVIKEGATFNLALTLHAPTVHISVRRPTVQLRVYAAENSAVGDLRPRIVRYIKDPIVTGGCPQCGTFLYDDGEYISSDAVYSGRNPDKGAFDDRRYVRCARCGWILNRDRHLRTRDGDQIGWGLKYEEIEAGGS